MVSSIANTGCSIYTQLNDFKYCYIIRIIQFNCHQLNCFKYSKGLISSIGSIDRTLTGTSTMGQSGSASNGNEGYSTFPKSPGPEPHDQTVLCHIQDTHWGIVSLFCRYVVDVLISS